jgi:hypothetical protein
MLLPLLISTDKNLDDCKCTMINVESIRDSKVIQGSTVREDTKYEIWNLFLKGRAKLPIFVISLIPWYIFQSSITELGTV